MERTTSFPSRRGILAGAALTAVPSVLLTGGRAGARPQAVDHPGAAWHPASRGNYTPSNRPRAHPLRYVVIHVAQTTFSGTLSVFRDPGKKVSAHYVVRSSDGRVAQCVRESDIAWHAGNWDYNTRSIGIEHEGWVDRPGYFTDAMYERSARLTAAICARYGIPRNRAHIIGHHEVPGSDHTDPGRHWDWKRYLRLVTSA
ncbi:N-acetylmuramoyl-L-alanine amidase [Streptomyces sp. NPDC050674]|uniref:N-acetylmuramoyl-L-alanine amidase n=1 Tax=Streptomyces sp. NPDC050674 TaxID=3157216 RepID=UPI00341CF21C